MPKISKNASITLSLVCCAVGFLGLIAMAVLLTILLVREDTFLFGAVPVVSPCAVLVTMIK